MIGAKAIRNGQLIDVNAAVVSVTSRPVQYSFSVYESLRVLGGKPVFLADHLARLAASAAGIGLAYEFDDKTLAEWIDMLIVAEGIVDCTLRILIIGGQEPICFITDSPLLTYPKSYYVDGIGLSSYSGERLFPTLKTSNLLMSYIALEKAKAKGDFEAVLVDRHGRILEGTRSNFFGFRDGRLYTAPDELVLSGITRMRVAKAASEMKMDVIYEAPLLNDVLAGIYDEVFISSTSMAAMPVAHVDKKVFSCNHDRTLAIMERIRVWEKQDRC
ncbi:MAG: aminotransferase class IV [Spirochaetia bacterium]|jgi:D-alanine transaminase/branched-chain amino acid aminotransferase|nr:aminotransferase class IV [Spirochaetia bacterium]